MAFAGQLIFNIKLLVQLKSLRLLVGLLTTACLLSNFYIYSAIESLIFSGDQSFLGLSSIDSNKLALTNKVVINDATISSNLRKLLTSRGATNTENFIEFCSSDEACRSRYFRLLHTTIDDSMPASIDSVSSTNNTIECITIDTIDLDCAYLIQLFYEMQSSSGSFKDSHNMVLVNQGSSSGSGQTIPGAPDIPGANCPSINAGTVYPFALLFLLVLSCTGIILFIIVAQLAPVSNLKSDGFFQLMIRNGMSVSSYWLAVWIVTFVEIVIIAAIFTASIFIQCTDKFTAVRLLLAFLGIVLLCSYFMAIGYLSTILIKSYFLTLLVMVALNVCTFTLILLARLLLPTLPEIWRNLSLALLPSGHIGEFIIYVLTSNEEASKVSGYIIAIPIVLGLSALAISLLTVYLDFIVANGNGLRLPASFVFNSDFWTNKLVDVDTEMNELAREQQQQQLPQLQANVEAVPDSVIAAIKISKLTKTYSSRLLPLPCFQRKFVHALKGVDGTIYKDQITAVIGHNGAGKTTLIKLLLGDESTTSGSAIMGHCELTNPIQRMQLRSSVGVCYQGDVLCGHLTVMQSIELALVSKGLDGKEHRDEAMDLLNRLGLASKAKAKATELSGGQQRKVCTILALIGKPKVIFLDEPTSGLDPVSRRRLWQILQEYKVGRSIILCTQFMDEADILADRKIFLSGGSLICAGSSLFLKHSFGCGFVFNVSLHKENMSDKLLAELKRICNGVQLSNQFRTELEIQVPLGDANYVPDILKFLESNKSLVDAFGLSQATLDEIFMKLKDVDVDNIIEAFQSGKLSQIMNSSNASMSKKRQRLLPQTTETTTTEAAAAATSAAIATSQQNLLANSDTSLPTYKATASATATVSASRASRPRQLQALVGMNLLRLRRDRAKLCCRFVFPALLVVVLVGSVFLERNFSLDDLPLKSSLNVFPSQAYGLCIRDAEDDYNLTRNDCSSALDTRDQSYIDIAVKKRAISLNQWLLREDSLQLLNRTCLRANLFSPCVFAYADHWHKTNVANANRTVFSGVFRSTFGGFTNLIINAQQQMKIGKAIVDYFNLNVSRTSYPTVASYRPYSLAFFIIPGCFILIMLLSIVPVTYISDPVEDRETRVRQQLGSMGMSNTAYWLNTFLMHYVQYAIFVICAAILFPVILPGRYGNLYFFVGVILPILLIGLASNQLSSYVIGSLLKKPNPLITVLYFFFVLFLSLSIPLTQTSNVTSMIMIWCLPPYAAVSILNFGLKLGFFALTFYGVSEFSDIPGGMLGDYFTDPIILQCICAAIVHVIILCCVLWLRESWSQLTAGLCSNSRIAAVKDSAGKEDDIDVGVTDEEARLLEKNQNDENAVEVRQLCKVYPSGVKAVRGVSFGPKLGEIFGLLGPNGAGKTTTLSIVVGEELASDGSCEVNFYNKWMSGRAGAIDGAVGYCPQHNPLFSNITVREHLEFYAKIRGVPNSRAKVQVDELIVGLKLSEHVGKQAHQLSGGNKRRLCLAISLLGNPSVLVIDEASTGVDPEAKRFIWQAIRNMAHDRRALMITTHSMEEVEALCSRVGIMNHGQMIGFGTVQQLRSRYGKAYTLDILVDDQSSSDEELMQRKQKIVQSIIGKFANATLIEDLYTRLQFSIPQSDIQNGLSSAVQWLTSCKQQLSITYSSFYQMSLDQVFVSLIKRQEDKAEEEEKDGARGRRRSGKPTSPARNV